MKIKINKIGLMTTLDSVNINSFFKGRWHFNKNYYKQPRYHVPLALTDREENQPSDWTL